MQILFFDALRNVSHPTIAIHFRGRQNYTVRDHMTTVKMPLSNDCVLPTALQVPSIKKLKGKRVVLASNSPRRKEILSTFVSAL